MIFDVPDLELVERYISVDTGGKTINYSDYGIEFYKVPVRYSADIVQNGSTMKYANFTNKSKTSVDVKILDINNNDVGGTIEELIIEGY
jgi:hypothetical protein